MSDAAKQTPTQRTTAQRTTAEWVTFAISCAVLLVVVGLVVLEMAASNDPPAPTATQAGPVRASDNHFFVPVEVVNDGDATAANVQVTAELVIGTQSYSGDQTIDFLGGGERAELAFSFDQDPAQGELDIRVSSYAVP
ncbi:MAG TPA: TIGR02588 family protein [Ilumatobacteraceae bacterium]